MASFYFESWQWNKMMSREKFWNYVSEIFNIIVYLSYFGEKWSEAKVILAV